MVKEEYGILKMLVGGAIGGIIGYILGTLLDGMAIFPSLEWAQIGLFLGVLAGAFGKYLKDLGE